MELNELRELALEALNARSEVLKQKIRGLQSEINGRTRIVKGSSKKRTHVISPEGRARIAAAQKRRWAAVKKSA